jgi:uncharacterized protein (DUF924 family)
MSPAQILEFWFSPRAEECWFDSNPEFDAEVREKFEGVFRAATAGALAGWGATPEGALALVIVLDQFPLNMYRGKGEAYSSGALAVAAARDAITRGFDRALSREQLQFLFLPFMHSESLTDQDESLALYGRANLSDNLRFARHHREIVRRFGRFPHRNAALGRVNTPEEEAYLASPGAYHG